MSHSDTGWKERLNRERRRHILEAAANVFAQKGYERATMREIALAAGISPGTIYLYFENKKDLLVNLPSLIAEPVMTEISGKMASFQEAESPEELEKVLTSLLHQAFALLTRNRDILRVLASAIPVMDEETREAYLRATPLPMGVVIGQIFRLLQEKGIFRSDADPQIAARALLTTCVSMVMLQDILPGDESARPDYEKVARELSGIFLRGMLAPRKEG